MHHAPCHMNHAPSAHHASCLHAPCPLHPNAPRVNMSTLHRAQLPYCRMVATLATVHYCINAPSLPTCPPVHFVPLPRTYCPHAPCTRPPCLHASRPMHTCPVHRPLMPHVGGSGNKAPTDRQLKKSRGTLEKQKLTRHAIAKRTTKIWNTNPNQHKLCFFTVSEQQHRACHFNQI